MRKKIVTLDSNGARIMEHENKLRASKSMP